MLFTGNDEPASSSTFLSPKLAHKNLHICCKIKTLEDIRNENLTARTWQCFFIQSFPLSLRQGQARHFFGLQGDYDSATLSDHFWLECLTVGG